MDSSQDKGEGFRISKIALGGAAGAFVAVAGVGMVLRGVPALRWPLLLTVLAGVVFGVGLFAFRRWR